MKRVSSLKWKIAKYLLVFTAGMIGLIILFQIVLLEPMYEQNKIRTVREASAQVIAALNSDDLSESVYRVSVQNDVCVRVFSRKDDISAGNMGCVLYRMNDFEFMQEISSAQNNNNTYLNTRKERFSGNEGTAKNILLTRIVGEDDDLHVVMVSTSVTPLNATTTTLKYQLWYISAGILVMVLVLVFLMNRHIARPLMQINKAAKNLSHGSYPYDEKTSQYQEAFELNETLRQAAQDIQRADQAKRDLIANVSHDLRTPLTMINGYGEMMRDLPGEKTDENIQVIIDESRRLTSLVNDLLDLSKLEENQITLVSSVFSMSALILREIRKYDVYAMKDNYVFDMNVEENLYVRADEKRIEQVFNNFITNAVNYSGSSRLIQIRCRQEEDVVHTEIEDFGEGIEEDKIKDIWDRYYKIDKSHVRFSSGSGIGLSIVRQILELHGSAYGVRSQKGKGSTFWFDLPLVKESESVPQEEIRQ